MLGLLRQHWWALALRGLFAVLFGICAIVWLIGVYAILFGVTLIGLGFRLRDMGDRLGSVAPHGA